jgi:rSAM/selenodomain-associated transferase 1
MSAAGERSSGAHRIGPGQATVTDPGRAAAAAGCATIVFAKAPVAGYAKTRLAGALGAEGAARLAARLLEEATAQAVAAGIGAVEVCAAPDCSHAAFGDLQRRFGVVLSDQGEGGLGERMARAFARTLAGHAGALLIGTDAPGLDAGYLREAAHRLQHDDVVIGPALDGGYALIGLRRAEPALFSGIAWSTPAVLVQTRARLAELGLTHWELEPLADIDEPADLRHVPVGWAVG